MTSRAEPGLAYIMKDLAMIGRDLARTAIIDNTTTVRMQPGACPHASRAGCMLLPCRGHAHNCHQGFQLGAHALDLAAV